MVHQRGKDLKGRERIIDKKLRIRNAQARYVEGVILGEMGVFVRKGPGEKMKGGEGVITELTLGRV